MPFTLRPSDFNPGDVAIFAEIRTACEPDQPLSAEHLQDWVSHRPTRCLQFGFVAERDGTAVGGADIGHSPFLYHPQKFNVSVHVIPGQRNTGIGSALYDSALDAIRQHDPVSLHASVRESRPENIRFAEQRGFTETMREWPSRLPLAGYDPERFASMAQRATDAGIVVKSVRDLIDSGAVDWGRKLHDMEMSALADVPMPSPFTPVPYDEWKPMVIGSRQFLPQAVFVALDGDRMIGCSALWKSSCDSRLDTGLTGVRREYRRLGIATALKLRALEYAKGSGAEEVRTDNASTNRGMLSINEKLGFEKLPASISMTKTIKADPTV